MKMKFVLSMLIILTFAGCDQAPNHSQTDGNSGLNSKDTTAISYRFSTNSCDTYQHIFNTQLELCRGVQVESINNNCAEDQRKAFFLENHCAALVTWDPPTAEKDLKNVNGKYIECQFSEDGNPVPMFQFTASNPLVMPLSKNRAVIYHSGKDGVYSLRMQIYDQTSNQLIQQLPKMWKNEVPVETTLDVGTSVLSCTIVPAQDPTHE